MWLKSKLYRSYVSDEMEVHLTDDLLHFTLIGGVLQTVDLVSKQTPSSFIDLTNTLTMASVHITINNKIHTFADFDAANVPLDRENGSK